MTPVLSCLRCGHEGTDVHVALVDLEAEAQADGGRIRDVEVVHEIAHRHITERHKAIVPERYGTEWRCRDKVACAERYREMTAPAVEEFVPWA